jgi:hypothetical protein
MAHKEEPAEWFTEVNNYAGPSSHPEVDNGYTAQGLIYKLQSILKKNPSLAKEPVWIKCRGGLCCVNLIETDNSKYGLDYECVLHNYWD